MSLGRPPIDRAIIQERVDSLCELICEGQTLRQATAKLGMSMGALLGHISADPLLSEQYARARDIASDIFETDILEAAHAASPETAAADRVKIDALKWIAARRAPKKYGDRIQQDVTVDVKDGLADKMAKARERSTQA